MQEIEIALKIALQAHKGKTDKGGYPYILHAIRVMNNVNSIEEKIVAVLHDVIEDSNYSFDDLRYEGISEKCIEAIKLLTHEKNIPYMDYIKQIANNEISRVAKLADLKDNSDTTRLKKITEKDKERVKKYRISISYLDSQI